MVGIALGAMNRYNPPVDCGKPEISVEKHAKIKPPKSCTGHLVGAVRLPTLLRKVLPR